MSLAALLTKFDAMELKMDSFGKQLVSTQESVDKIHEKQAMLGAAPATFSVTQDPTLSSTTRPPARLVNQWQLLLEEPHLPTGVGFIMAPASPAERVVPEQVQPPAQVIVSARHQEHQSEQHQVRLPNREHDHEYHAKPPKHNFPRFSGENPRMWLDMALTYFEMYNISPHQWVSTATLYLEGHVALWWQAYKRRRPILLWEEFSGAVVQEFGEEEFETQMHSLLQLRQTGSVSEYRSAFEAAMYHLIALDPSLNTIFFISHFVFGLKDEVHTAVHLQAPTSVTRAVALAKIQEEELELQKTKPRYQRFVHHQPGLPAVSPVPPVPKKNTDDF